MAADDTLVPQQFGPLHDVRIVSSGGDIAQPFAAELAAEMGAEVIHIEPPKLGDLYRRRGYGITAAAGAATVSADWIQERRNMFCVTLDPAAPRGRELMLRLLLRADLWMESSAPGACDRIGLDDAAVLKACPRLVITHVTDFGRDAGPDRAVGDDSIAQAFGGMMGHVGFPDPQPPIRAMPSIADYMTSLCALWSSLAALVHARATGQGQSIDVAKYEVVHKHLGSTMIDFFQRGAIATRYGNKSPGAQPLDTFRASDEWVMIAALREQYGRLCRLFGLDPAEEKWKNAAWHVFSPDGLGFDAIFRAWVAQRSAAEVLRELGEIGVPCSRVMSSDECAHNPQFSAREMHIEWEDGQVGKVKGIGMVPKLSATPGQIWRGSVGLGHDNRLIYGELLGLDVVEIEDLTRAGVI